MDREYLCIKKRGNPLDRIPLVLFGDIVDITGFLR
jgi:hypothetical protein